VFRLGDARARSPAHNRFTYPLFYLRLRSAGWKNWAVRCSRDRPRPISFRYRDHASATAATRCLVRRVAGPRGVAADGEVVLQTMPRLFGFVSTRSASGLPRPFGRIARRLCEVNNTSASATTTCRASGRPADTARRNAASGQVFHVRLLPGARRVPLPLDRRGRVARRRSTITRAAGSPWPPALRRRAPVRSRHARRRLAQFPLMTLRSWRASTGSAAPVAAARAFPPQTRTTLEQTPMEYERPDPAIRRLRSRNPPRSAALLLRLLEGWKAPAEHRAAQPRHADARQRRPCGRHARRRLAVFGWRRCQRALQ